MTDERGPPTPEEAFAVLGNQTRLAVLRELAAADEPLPFTELRSRVGLKQGAQFNYHLTKLVGHFVEKTAAGYALRQPGERVVQAVLAGAVDAGPALDPTPVDFDCLFCGTDIEVSYDDGLFALHCPGCGGNSPKPTTDRAPHERHGNLALVPFPPAGMGGRTPSEVLRAAATWAHLDGVALSSGVCPRCSAAVAVAVDPCTDHDASGGRCPRCDHRHAVRPRFDCTNCTYASEFVGVMALTATPELLAFVGSHGLNVTSLGLDWGWEYEEELLSTDPFSARLTVTIDGDALALTVDEQFHVVEATTS